MGELSAAILATQNRLACDPFSCVAVGCINDHSSYKENVQYLCRATECRKGLGAMLTAWHPHACSQSAPISCRTCCLPLPSCLREQSR